MGSGLLEEFHPLKGIVCLVQYTTWEHMGVSLREEGVFERGREKVGGKWRRAKESK